MAKTVKCVRVLVASPGDLAPEREALSMVADELNIGLAALDVRIEVLRAEKNVVPEMGERAQAVVNAQIGSEYEVFVGILGARFGSPTGVADSGTEEEFRNAVERWKKTGTPRVMLYFKESGPVLSAIDPDQLRKVQEFKKDAGGGRAFYVEFRDTSGFTNLVRLHLMDVVIKSAQSEAQSVPMEKRTATAITLTQDFEIAEDEGFLDLVEEGTRGFEESNESIGRLSASMEDLSEDMEKRNVELRRELAKLPNANSGLIQRTLRRAGSDIERLGKTIQAERPVFQRSFELSIKCLGRAVTLTKTMKVADKTTYGNLERMSAELRQSMETASDQLQQFSMVVTGLPPYSTAINRAKKYTGEQVTALVGDLEDGVALVEELERIIGTNKSEI
jgi:hypothetical protein